MSSPPRPESTARLLLFVDNFDVGGTQNQFVKLVNGLAAHDRYELHVGCLKPGGPLARDLAVPLEQITSFPLRRFYDARGLRQIARLAAHIIKQRYALVHSLDFYANIICAAATRVAPSRLVVSRRYQKLSDRALHAVGERWTYRVADAVVFNSRNVADRLVADGIVDRAKAVVIANGLDLNRYRGARAGAPLNLTSVGGSAKPRIGVVASLREAKDHKTLIEAVAKVREWWPTLEVILVGDGELRGALQSLVDTLHLGDTVRFVGEQSDVRPWIQSFDIAILPSQREGMPNALLEYLAMGRPVIATAVGAVPEVVRHGKEALLVPPRDSAQLAGAIHELLASQPRRDALAAAALERIKEYGVHRMVRSHEAVYQRLLAEHTAASPIRRVMRTLARPFRGLV